MREAGFLPYLLFRQKQMGEAGFYFLFSQKTDQACIFMSCYTLRQCSMGGELRPLMIFGPIQEPCWTLNQAIFLKNGPSQLPL